jgi:hypothetical protein
MGAPGYLNLLSYRQRQKGKTKYANIKNPLVADGKAVQLLESGVCNAKVSKVRLLFDTNSQEIPNEIVSLTPDHRSIWTAVSLAMGAK